jgi:hypothetical protein
MPGCSAFSVAPTAGNIVQNLQRNAVKERRRFLLNLWHVSKSPLGQKQNGGCVPPPPRPISLLATFFMFPRMNQDLIGMRLSDVVEVQQELLVAP